MIRVGIAFVLGLVVGACSGDDDASPGGVSDGPDAASKYPPDAPVEEAGSDAARPPPPPLPQCVGTAIPLEQTGERTYVQVDMKNPDLDAGEEAGLDGGLVGSFLLDFGSNGSTIDRNAFPNKPEPAFCNGDGGAPGAYCYFNHFDFFGPWGQVGLVTADYSFLFNSVLQAGIIGTDFLSVYPFTLDFYGQRILKATKETFCTEPQLLAAGYVPIPTGGFYVNDTSKLRPLKDVIDDAGANFTVPNIPTVPIAIAGATALAQLDTGYDDRLHRHSININETMLAKLLAMNPPPVSRYAYRDLYLTTCVPGLSQKGRAYKLVEGANIDFLLEGGTVGRRDTGDLIFVKETLPEARACGGIETWTVPAAQMGNSFLVDAQAVVIDPFASRVWMPKQ